MLFHKHKWIKIKETYIEPCRPKNVSRVYVDDLLRLTSGMTTILWECEICNKTKIVEMLGKEK